MKNSENYDLKKYLQHLSIPGSLFHTLESEIVQCFACAHQCTLKPGQSGICQLRFNQGGTLMVPWGYVNAAQLDPIEKKPFNHFLPGALTLSFGMLGCNFHCDFCQNWMSAQALNDKNVHFPTRYISEVTPKELIQSALQNKVKIIVSTYNEPFITTEWAIDIFKLARENGLKTAYVSNGFASEEGLKKLAPFLDAIKIDLKSSSEETYRQLGGSLSPVLATIALAKELGIWVEVVTLTIPGFNETHTEVWNTARMLSQIDPNIPWHVTAFHPDYKMQDRGRTTASVLQTTAEIGEEAGLNYVYAGNLPGKVGSLEDTHCPNCQKPVIERHGFSISRYNISKDGQCNFCGTPIPGIWHPNPTNQKLTEWTL